MRQRKFVISYLVIIFPVQNLNMFKFYHIQKIFMVNKISLTKSKINIVLRKLLILAFSYIITKCSSVLLKYNWPDTAKSFQGIEMTVQYPTIM